MKRIVIIVCALSWAHCAVWGDLGTKGRKGCKWGAAFFLRFAANKSAHGTEGLLRKWTTTHTVRICTSYPCMSSWFVWFLHEFNSSCWVVMKLEASVWWWCVCVWWGGGWGCYWVQSQMVGVECVVRCMGCAGRHHLIPRAGHGCREPFRGERVHLDSTFIPIATLCI